VHEQQPISDRFERAKNPPLDARVAEPWRILKVGGRRFVRETSKRLVRLVAGNGKEGEIDIFQKLVGIERFTWPAPGLDDTRLS
jgi:hypothetical protein